YEMRVIQHPIRSRVASVMDAVDHRPIDPAPVIELVASSIPASTLANVYRLYMTATLITASTAHLDYDGAEALQQSGAAVTTTAVADIPSSLTASNDHLANERLIFAFPSLSVRLEGHYRLRFSLFETISDGYGGCQVEYRGSVVSNPFTVYAAKKFPGMMPASDLSRMLAERGIRVRVRNETAAKQ
ncbi:hypothetical protein GQ42DRAFT_115046, partial [Ramicandelaber brevisporus]